MPPYSNVEENRFRNWYSGWANQLGLNPNPYDPNHYYDYKVPYEMGVGAEFQPEHGDYRWPDAGKLQNYPATGGSLYDTYIKPAVRTLQNLGTAWGPAEVAASWVTDPMAKAVGGWGEILDTYLGVDTGIPDLANKYLRYNPQTQAGQELEQSVAAGFQPVAGLLEKAQDETREELGPEASTALGTTVEGLPYVLPLLKATFPSQWSGAVKGIKNSPLGNQRGQIGTPDQPLFHGTSAKFRKFNDKFLSTGEGGQALGKGHYTTESNPVAKGYAFADAERKSGSGGRSEAVVVIRDGKKVERLASYMNNPKDYGVNADLLSEIEAGIQQLSDPVLAKVHKIKVQETVPGPVTPELRSLVEKNIRDGLQGETKDLQARAQITKQARQELRDIQAKTHPDYKSVLKDASTHADVVAYYREKLETAVQQEGYAKKRVNNIKEIRDRWNQVKDKMEIESVEPPADPFLYKLILHEGKDPSTYKYMQFDQKLSSQELSNVRQALTNNLEDQDITNFVFRKPKTEQAAEQVTRYSKLRNFNEPGIRRDARMQDLVKAREELLDLLIQDGDQGRNIFDSLNNAFSKRPSLERKNLVQKVLKEAGYSGNKVPTGSLSRGAKKTDKYNYVTFDPKDIKILGREKLKWDDRHFEY